MKHLIPINKICKSYKTFLNRLLFCIPNFKYMNCWIVCVQLLKNWPIMLKQSEEDAVTSDPSNLLWKLSKESRYFF